MIIKIICFFLFIYILMFYKLEECVLGGKKNSIIFKLEECVLGGNKTIIFKLKCNMILVYYLNRKFIF